MIDDGIRAIRKGDMPIVLFFSKEWTTNRQTVVTLWDPTEDEIKLQCEDFGIDPEAILKSLCRRPQNTHTFAIDVNIVRNVHPLRDSYI